MVRGRSEWPWAGPRRVFFLALALICLGAPATALANRERQGTITYVGDGVVEIGGERILVGPAAEIRSQGRNVSLGSLRRGMPAEAEIDEAGRLIELRVKGVVE